MIKEEEIKITCEDGVQLSAILFLASEAKGMVQINSATAVPKEFYKSFAKYLAKNGYHSIIFDYRGVNSSIPENGLKNCNFSILDWATKDMVSVKVYSNGRFPELPLFFAGHSVGGQLLVLFPQHEQVKAMFAFATSSGFWGNMPFLYRMQTLFFFYFVHPITRLLFGFSKLKWFGLMEDLPSTVTQQWKEWCSKPDYFFAPENYPTIREYDQSKNLNLPILVVSTQDDRISSLKNVELLWKHISSKKGIQFQELKPMEIGLKEIGHFGFFRKNIGHKLWPIALNFFNDNL